MSVLIVKEVLETGKPYKPEGKDYAIYGWQISGTVDGVEKKLLTVKAFKEMTLEPGVEYQVEGKDYKGTMQYTIKTEGGGGKWNKGYTKTVYTQAEYDALFTHAIEFVSAMSIGLFTPEVMAPMVSTYMIGALNGSVKIDTPPHGKTAVVDPDNEFYQAARK